MRQQRCAVGEFSRRNEFGKNVHNSWEFPFLDLPNRDIYQKDVKGHFGCVNAIEASADENFLASGKSAFLLLFISLFTFSILFELEKLRNDYEFCMQFVLLWAKLIVII